MNEHLWAVTFTVLGALTSFSTRLFHWLFHCLKFWQSGICLDKKLPIKKKKMQILTARLRRCELFTHLWKPVPSDCFLVEEWEFFLEEKEGATLERELKFVQGTLESPWSGVKRCQRQTCFPLNVCSRQVPSRVIECSNKRLRGGGVPLPRFM